MKDLAHCEVCDQRVGTYGADAEGRRRVMPHKRTDRRGAFWRVDWCEGRFERKEDT